MGEESASKPTEAELTVIAVSRTLFDLLITNRVLSANAVDNLLAIQQRGFEKQGLSSPAGAIAMIRTLLSKTRGVEGGKH